MQAQVIHEHPLDFVATQDGLDYYVCKDPSCGFVGFQTRECH